MRLIMGYKGLAWKSVQIPMVMPKPDLTCLTGGYRKTPVLQIGADIYCDTKTIAHALECVRPQPTLYPQNCEASERALSSMADAMFLMAVFALLGAGLFPQEFIDDRQKMLPGGFDMQHLKRAFPAKLDQLRVSLAALDAQLSDGRHFLLGEKICLADFSIYNPVSFLPTAPTTASLLAPFKRLAAWRERMASIGHGERTQLAAALLAVENDLRRLLEHHGAGRGVAHRLPDGHEAVALEDGAAAHLERLADRVRQLLRARHEPRHDPGVGEEDRVRVDGWEGLVRDPEGSRHRRVRVHGRRGLGPRLVRGPVHLVLDRRLGHALADRAVGTDADEVVGREPALVHLARRDPVELGIGAARADVPARRGEEPHLEELVRDLDDLLLRFLIGPHGLLFARRQPPRSTRPGRRSTGTVRSTSGSPFTNTYSTPSAPWRSRRCPPGRSWTTWVGRVATRVGSKSTRSAAYPAVSRPRPRIP